MPKPQRLVAEPKQYTIPDDLTQERYQEILLAMGEFYAQHRVTKEPVALARQELQYCMDGVTKAGLPWYAMASSTLTARVRSMCRFDIEALKPIEKASEVNRRKKDREKERLKQRAQHDEAIPEELRKGRKRTANYGDSVGTILSTAEDKAWKEYRKGVLKEHPELNTVTSAPMLDKLCDLKITQDRQRLNFLMGGAHKPDPVDERYVAQQMTELMKSLGVHADQLAKKVQSKQDTTIGAAAARLDALGDDWRKVRLTWWAQELLQTYQMFMQPSADGLSYQLDEIGLFGITKSRVVCCPRCGTKNFAGFTIDEIEAWLVKEGYLKKLGDGAPVFSPARAMAAQRAAQDGISGRAVELRARLDAVNDQHEAAVREGEHERANELRMQERELQAELLREVERAQQ